MSDNKNEVPILSGLIKILLKEMNHGFHNNVKRHKLFNIDNKQKCFLSRKSAYENDF